MVQKKGRLPKAVVVQKHASDELRLARDEVEDVNKLVARTKRGKKGIYSSKASQGRKQPAKKFTVGER
jgi:hypothetical protein